MLLRGTPSSSTGREVFQDCSGGNSRPSRPFGRGGRYFLLSTVPPSSSRHFNWTLAFMLIGLSTIAAGVFVFNRCASLHGRTTKETVDQLERVGRDLRDAIVQITQLQPPFTIHNRVYFEQTSPIAEL